MPKPDPRLTIIIPVYNGAKALPDTLEALGRQARADMRVVIVANGCKDDSATVAQREADTHLPGLDVQLIELAQGSRPAALNAGLARSSGIRVMLDQDAVLGPGTLAALEQAIDQGAHFATARLVWGGPASWPVRAALGAWSELPYVKRSPVSAGLYAFSSTCRARFDQYPMHLPDDKWVRLLCQRSERVRLADVEYRVTPPPDFAGLVAARRRYAESNLRLASACPNLLERELSKTDGLLGMATRPALWPGISMLTMAEAIARYQSRA